MDLQTVLLIGVPVLGGAFSILLGLISFLAIRSSNAIDKNMEKNSDAIANLALSIKDLAGNIKSIERQFLATYSDTERSLSELREEIELCRERTHQTLNHITSIRLQGELKCGWKFSKEWEMPGLTQVKDKSGK